MEDETQEIKNEDGKCGMKSCDMTATDIVMAKVPEPFAVGDVTMDIRVHVCKECVRRIVNARGAIFSMANFNQQTSDGPSSVKEKSDADASEKHWQKFGEKYAEHVYAEHVANRGEESTAGDIEVVKRSNQDGSCVAEGCVQPATTGIDMMPGEVWMVCGFHEDMEEPTHSPIYPCGKKGCTVCYPGKDGETEPKCEFAGYGDFVSHELVEIRERAVDLAERGERDPLMYDALIDMAKAADYLHLLYQRQLIGVETCAILGCANAAHAEVLEDLVQFGPVVDAPIEDAVRLAARFFACQPCIKEHNFTIKPEEGAAKEAVSSE